MAKENRHRIPLCKTIKERKKRLSEVAIGVLDIPFRMLYLLHPIAITKYRAMAIRGVFQSREIL